MAQIQGLSGTPKLTELQLGSWNLKISGEEIFLSPGQVVLLEHTLNEKWLPLVRNTYDVLYSHNYAMRSWEVPSLVVRLDMAPLSEEDSCPGIYEVDANPSGYGITCFAGVPIAREIARAMKGLGIDQIGYGVAMSRADQEPDLIIFVNMLVKEGIEIERINFANPPREFPLWLRGGEEDMLEISRIVEQCLLLHSDGGGDKGYLRELTGAKSVGKCDDPFAEFPDGFAIKPLKGWGTRFVHIWASKKPWKDSASTKSQVERALSAIRANEEDHTYLVQPFFPPHYQNDKSFRIWRVYAVWTPNGYQIIGGVWHQRRSMRIHGSEDSVLGPIFVTGHTPA